jgi:hypothetical protein
MLTLREPSAGAAAERFRFGFIGSSDTHTTRPGTGYKEVAPTEMSDVRLAHVAETLSPLKGSEEPEPFSRSVRREDFRPNQWLDSERAGSFFTTGGLVAVHSEGREREAIFEALERRHVYATSGPRILLWFDLLNPPDGDRLPMGSEVAMRDVPVFEVRATGSLEQQPGCPAVAAEALGPERLAWLCSGECYHPSDRRRRIDRIEVVRVRPRATRHEPTRDLIDDPWRVLPCPPGTRGCRVTFWDDEFGRAGRDTLYYVRAIEEAAPAFNGANLRCERSAEGTCVDSRPCDASGADCMAPTEQRAWSSPIFVDFDAPG